MHYGLMFISVAVFMIPLINVPHILDGNFINALSLLVSWGCAGYILTIARTWE